MQRRKIKKIFDFLKVNLYSTFQNRIILKWPTRDQEANFEALYHDDKCPLNVCKRDFEIVDT